MATITKKTDGSRTFYEVRYDAGRHSNGSRRQSRRRFERRRDAEAFLAQQKEALRQGIYIEPARQLVSEYMLEWLAEQRQRLSPNTYSGYEVNIRCHINPHLGGIRLQDLKSAQIRRLYTELQNPREVTVDGRERYFKPLSATSVHYVHRVLHKALEDAARDELIPRNPADKVQLPSRQKYQAAFLTAQQIRKMLEALVDDDLYMPVMLAALLGLRRGEALGLQWQDIDWDNNIIGIHHTIVNDAGHQVLLQRTKTDAGCREIIATHRIMQELRQHQLKQKQMRLALFDMN